MYWYKQYFFIDKVLSKQITIYVGKYIELFSEKIRSMQYIYIYCLSFDNTCQYFLFIQLLKIASYKDDVFNLNIFHYTNINQIVTLFTIKPAKLYFIPIKWSKNAPLLSRLNAKKNYIYCDWNINFLWYNCWFFFRFDLKSWCSSNQSRK